MRKRFSSYEIAKAGPENEFVRQSKALSLCLFKTFVPGFEQTVLISRTILLARR